MADGFDGSAVFINEQADITTIKMIAHAVKRRQLLAHILKPNNDTKESPMFEAQPKIMSCSYFSIPNELPGIFLSSVPEFQMGDFNVVFYTLSVCNIYTYQILNRYEYSGVNTRKIMIVDKKFGWFLSYDKVKTLTTHRI